MVSGEGERQRVGFLGPPGTFSEQALLASVCDADRIEAVAQPTIRSAVMAVQRREVRWSLVPIENSTEGSVTVTLDALAGEADAVRIVAETVLAVTQCLIARERLALADIEVVLSHPQATGQCERFLRERLPQAQVRAAPSTADAVRALGGDGHERWAAIGPALAADRYGMQLLLDGIQDHDGNETRFVWCAHVDDDVAPAVGRGRMKTSLVFWGAGAEKPGWLVDCLGEFARRAVNLTKIESRPRRDRLGRYMFFVDVEGGVTQDEVAEAIDGLARHCEEVRMLGSYPAWS